jgi:hypothetical protein
VILCGVKDYLTTSRPEMVMRSYNQNVGLVKPSAITLKCLDFGGLNVSFEISIESPLNCLRRSSTEIALIELVPGLYCPTQNAHC